MLESVFHFLRLLDEFFWGYIGFILIVILGLYLTIYTGFYQVRAFPKICKTFFHYLKQSSPDKKGIHPLKAFFASTGGMIGIGNVVGIITAIQFGGPGALFWVWVAGMIGAILKYFEIYLGLKYRVENKEGGYDGGPIYFLPKAFKNRFLPICVAFLLCIYGIEIYQFSIITESVHVNWHLNRVIVIGLLLGFVLYSGTGGVKRIGKISSLVVPVFLAVYTGMGLWIIFSEAAILPTIFATVFKSALTGHAAIGGFAGSSVILAIQHGIARSSYSSDVGVGYDSIIQSESSTVHPERQARLAILGVFIDNVICTVSILVVLVSGIWMAEPMEGSFLIQEALGSYFPYMQFFIPFFFIATGYTTIIAYFVVGIKCARYLSPKWGKYIYIFYGIFAFISFSFVSQKNALLIMSLSGGSLLIINLLAIFRLRKEISFSEDPYFEINNASLEVD